MGLERSIQPFAFLHPSPNSAVKWTRDVSEGGSLMTKDRIKGSVLHLQSGPRRVGVSWGKDKPALLGEWEKLSG